MKKILTDFASYAEYKFLFLPLFFSNYWPLLSSILAVSQVPEDRHCFKRNTYTSLELILHEIWQAKTAEEEVNLVQNAVSKSTQYKNKWAYEIFEVWQRQRLAKVPERFPYNPIHLLWFDILDFPYCPLSRVLQVTLANSQGFGFEFHLRSSPSAFIK